MIDLNIIKDNLDLVKKAAKSKNINLDWEKIIKLTDKAKELQTKVESLRNRRNGLNEKLSRGKDEASMTEATGLKTDIEKVETELKEVAPQLKEEYYKIPNIPAADVPIGKDESENKVIRKWGEPTKFDFQPKDHLELGEKLGIIEVGKAAQVTGARFAYLKGEGALLEFALIQHTIKVLTNEKILKDLAEKIGAGFSAKPFVPVVPPVLIRPEVFEKMARLDPTTMEERYFLPKDDLYLVGSAEHTLGPLHMDEIIQEKELPIRYVGFSTSFRREAGSYGKDTRGILRVHQFDKIEMESFTTPENSINEQNFIVSIQEYLLQSLKIPYQVVMICTGDMGVPDSRQIDMECWLPGEDKYRETHTSDLMTDYQARRLNIRIKREDGKTQFVHMNDATAFAIGRTIIAILENYQQEDGTVQIPEVLIPYVGLEKISK